MQCRFMLVKKPNQNLEIVYGWKGLLKSSPVIPIRHLKNDYDTYNTLKRKILPIKCCPVDGDCNIKVKVVFYLRRHQPKRQFDSSSKIFWSKNESSEAIPSSAKMSGIRKTAAEYYGKFCEYMESDTKGVEIATYAASGILFAIAYYRVRPITKFGKASDIPNYFLRNKIKQYGLIEGIEPSPSSGPLLLVNHKPPLSFLVPSKKLLPIKLSSVTVNANGYSWLQTVAVGNKIEFIPLEASKDYAECRVLLMCPKYNKDRVDLSETLISLGFGNLADPPKKVHDLDLQKYLKSLLKKEAFAKNERLGLWSYSLPPKPWAVRKIKVTLNSLLRSILPARLKLHELVR